MRNFIIYSIRLYWWVVPINLRRTCLFKESCSVHVLKVAIKDGFIKALLAFRKRFSQCRSGYKLIKDEKSNSFELYLKDGSMLTNNYISEKLLPPFKFKYTIKNKI